MQYFSPTVLWQQRRSVLWCGLIAVIAIELVVLLTLCMPAIERRMDSWGLLPRQQQMTELAVANVQTLDRSFVAGQPKDVAFVVRNREATAQKYPYTITVANGDRSASVVVARGSVQAKPGATATIAAGVQLPADMGKRLYVSVELTDGQTVGYWLEQGYVL